MTRLRQELELLSAAVIFLTRLPLPALRQPPEDQLARAARYFPVAGLIVGVITGIVWLIAHSHVGATLAAGLALAAGVLATGALHEDGLADCCDGLGGGASREKALEIMRDSRIGTYGAIGLLFSFGLRWSALATFAAGTGFTALLVAHTVSRAMIVVTVALLRYAREDGTAAPLAAGIEGGEVGIAVAIAFGVTSVLAGWAGIYALVLSAILGGFVIWLLLRRLKGYTGDGLGAVQQVTEIAALVALAGVVV